MSELISSYTRILYLFQQSKRMCVDETNKRQCYFDIGLKSVLHNIKHTHIIFEEKNSFFACIRNIQLLWMHWISSSCQNFNGSQKVYVVQMFVCWYDGLKCAYLSQSISFSISFQIRFNMYNVLERISDRFYLRNKWSTEVSSRENFGWCFKFGIKQYTYGARMPSLQIFFINFKFTKNSSRIASQITCMCTDYLQLSHELNQNLVQIPKWIALSL